MSQQMTEEEAAPDHSANVPSSQGIHFEELSTQLPPWCS
jgi:hypothetical protein